MTFSTISTGTWVNIGKDCPLRVSVSGSDLANIIIGNEEHSIELILNAEGLRSLATVSTNAVAEMDTSSEQAGTARATTDLLASTSTEELNA